MLERETKTEASQGDSGGTPQIDPAYTPDTYQVVINVVTGETQIWGYRDGGRVESYRLYKKGEASIAVNAILSGFQPPRDLRRLDTPSG